MYFKTFILCIKFSLVLSIFNKSLLLSLVAFHWERKSLLVVEKVKFMIVLKALPYPFERYFYVIL